MVELAGTWRLRVVDEKSGEGGDDGGREVSLPAAASALDLPAGSGTIRLWRELDLRPDWRRHLAPSGLAVLISESAFSSCEVSVGEIQIGSWSMSAPGVARPIERVFEVPAAVVDPASSLRLALRCQSYGRAASRSFGPRLEIGAGWLAGDLKLLEHEAERMRLEHLNGELPLLVLALLYAALGLYHLQLFRRDRRCREYLWFGLLSMIVAGHTVQLSYWVSEINFRYVGLQRLHLATGLVLVAISIQFLWTFVDRPIGPWLRRYQWTSLAFAGLAVVLPESLWTAPVAFVIGFWGPLFLPPATFVLGHEIWYGRSDVRIVAIGGFVAVSVGVVEFVSQILGKGTVFPLQAYAFAVFATSMAFSLSNRFSTVHSDLDLLRLQLEDMVEDRASELSVANQRLRSEIAERELAQEAMHMLERAVEQSIDGILIADLEENVLFVNQAWTRLHGRETFEIVGCRLDVCHNAEQLEQVRAALDDVRSQGSWEGELGHLKRDGSTFPTWMSVTLLRDPEDQSVGFVMVARDLQQRRQEERERQRMEARIQEAEKLRSLADLAGGIAHDYNNLLTGVLGNSSLALHELPAGSPASDKLAQIVSAGERAAELTAQLLAYAGTERPLPERATAKPNRRWRASGKVLVVDDEFTMREVSRSILEQRGFEVLTTGDGRQAIEIYRQHMPSIRLVLLDRTMPAMSGEVVLEQILNLDPGARIVLMSGYHNDATVRELTDQGLAEFLPKPFGPDELIEKVRELVA